MTDTTESPTVVQNAPSISKERIEALYGRTTFCGGHIEGTTTTVLHAFLDERFHLGSAESACVSPENFDEDVGLRIAHEKLGSKVIDKLWELEGYRLFMELNPELAAL